MNFVKQSEQKILTVLKILYLCFPNNLHIVILRNFFLTLDAMVLNEPTAALDKESIARLMNCLQERKNDSVIIMVSHDPDVLAQCDAALDICSIQHSNPDRFDTFF